jgi:DNA-binding beta-propeller fold protein YncE
LGNEGSDDGQFVGPHGIDIDTDGRFFVADTFNDRIQKFDNNGTFTRSWCHFGTGDDELGVVYGIKIDPKKGHVFVCNTNGRIQIFTKNGGFIKSWGGHGAGDGEFISSSGITVDLASNVLVAEVNRIQKFMK